VSSYACMNLLDCFGTNEIYIFEPLQGN
jgi:hypothetical protein